MIFSFLKNSSFFALLFKTVTSIFFSCKDKAIAFAVPPAPNSSTLLTFPKDSMAFKKPGASVL